MFRPVIAAQWPDTDGVRSAARRDQNYKTVDEWFCYEHLTLNSFNLSSCRIGAHKEEG